MPYVIAVNTVLYWILLYLQKRLLHMRMLAVQSAKLQLRRYMDKPLCMTFSLNLGVDVFVERLLRLPI